VRESIVLHVEPSKITARAKISRLRKSKAKKELERTKINMLIKRNRKTVEKRISSHYIIV
jgi:hypothetical protein